MACADSDNQTPHAAEGKLTGSGHYLEPARRLPVRQFDVVIAGGGTAGVAAALAAARRGASTALVEAKGYTGGIITEGGTALHSFYNLWKAFPGVEKRQVVRGIPLEIVDRLMRAGACSGHAEMTVGYDYDSVCTAIDTELYKSVTLNMLRESGVCLLLNTLLVDAAVEGPRLHGTMVESRSGRELLAGEVFVDCTGAGDLCARAGAEFSEPNDYAVANSIGLGNVDVQGYYEFLEAHDAVSELARGRRSGVDGQIVRLSGRGVLLPEEFRKEAQEIGMATVTTTVHDDYFMFVKLNLKMERSPICAEAVNEAEIELRNRQRRAVELFRRHVPGCQKAFIARTSPRLCMRRGRMIVCDYDISHEDVVEGRHFGDDVMAYGFHDMAPRYQVGGGGTYGVPYRALRVRGLENLLACGMMITSDRRAHMSTRNTVCCMGQGQAAGTAAALCAHEACGTRDLDYAEFRTALEEDGVWLEN